MLQLNEQDKKKLRMVKATRDILMHIKVPYLLDINDQNKFPTILANSNPNNKNYN